MGSEWGGSGQRIEEEEEEEEEIWNYDEKVRNEVQESETTFILKVPMVTNSGH